MLFCFAKCLLGCAQTPFVLHRADAGGAFVPNAFITKKIALGFFHAGRILGYDARVCHFNMDTGCVELLLRDGRKISIDCTGVEDALDVTMAQRSELDYLIYNDPLGYANLILDSEPEEYLKNAAGSHGLEI